MNYHKDEIFSGCVASLHYEFERKFSSLIQKCVEVCMHLRSGISDSSWQYRTMFLWNWCLWHRHKLTSKYSRKKAGVGIMLFFHFQKPDVWNDASLMMEEKAAVTWLQKSALIQSFDYYGIFAIFSTVFYSFCMEFCIILWRIIWLLEEVVDIKDQAISTRAIRHSWQLISLTIKFGNWSPIFSMRKAEKKCSTVIQNTMKTSIKSVGKFKQEVVKTSFIEYAWPL